MHYEYPESASKKYVKVRADFYPDGRIIPLKFKMEDGDAIIIDQILDIRQAPSLKAGGQGMRYTCRSGETIYNLFHDRAVWFIEL